jgi:hypothetical protein
MHFIIQTVNNQVVHDFSFTLIRSIEYHNWLHPNTHTYELSETPIFKENTVLCGDTKFVTEFIEGIKPLNVPESLFKYAGRKIMNGTEKDVTTRSFVKSNDVIKGFTDITDHIDTPGNYQISSIIDDITSEYRCFVYKKKLVGIHYYSGDFTIFPDINTINDMIKDFDYEHPYTLDVGVSDNKTIIIEVHDMFSCGLYGFSDMKIYPKMLIDSFKHISK